MKRAQKEAELPPPSQPRTFPDPDHKVVEGSLDQDEESIMMGGKLASNGGSITGGGKRMRSGGQADGSFTHIATGTPLEVDVVGTRGDVRVDYSSGMMMATPISPARSVGVEEEQEVRVGTGLTVWRTASGGMGSETGVSDAVNARQVANEGSVVTEQNSSRYLLYAKHLLSTASLVVIVVHIVLLSSIKHDGVPYSASMHPHGWQEALSFYFLAELVLRMILHGAHPSNFLSSAANSVDAVLVVLDMIGLLIRKFYDCIRLCCYTPHPFKTHFLLCECASV